MEFTFTISKEHLDEYVVYDSEGPFAVINLNIATKEWEFRQTEEVYLTLNGLKEIVNFMEKECINESQRINSTTI